MTRRTVAVVGGGCSGVLIVRELLRCTGDDVILIEPDEPGGGVAYGSAQPWHLLNSRAGAMSADPDDPGHFARWAGRRGLPTDPHDFLPRRVYGDYLRDVFATAAAGHPHRLRVLPARATGLTPGPAGWSVTAGPAAPGTPEPAGAGATNLSALVRADQVVLAIGNPAGARPVALPRALDDHPSYIRDPWRPGALDRIPGGAPVLLVGAGLTAVDVVLSLTADGSRGAPIVAVSRRGQLPLSHTVEAAPPAMPALGDCATLRHVVRAVRASAAQAGDWRAVVDGLRPYLDELWVAFTAAEQDAFLRHLARPWECHRHRMAPSVAARVAALRAEGALHVRAGGLRAVTAEPGGGLAVEFGAPHPGGTGDRCRFAAVVNCSGPGRLPAAATPFLAGMLRAGLARTGPHALGLDIDAAGRVVAADGRPQPGLWLVGPLRRGTRWETTAVPEIRAQARRLAMDLAAEPIERVGRVAAEPVLDAA